MAGKRKRARKEAGRVESIAKRPCAGSALPDHGSVKHPLLHLHYPKVLTLRQYLLSQPASFSKSRYRRIALAGRRNHNLSGSASYGESHSDQPLSRLLDTTVIGIPNGLTAESIDQRLKHLASFSQQAASTVGSNAGTGSSSQSEIIDSAIWLLFHKMHPSVYRPIHLLCRGYERAGPRSHAGLDPHGVGIPGILAQCPNDHVAALKGSQWSEVRDLLGKEGERIMLSLVLDCGIFVGVSSGKDNFCQLSGIPINKLPILERGEMSPSTLPHNASKVKTQGRGGDLRSPKQIVFVRNRMFHARAALNAKGEVRFGLRHIHVLNRYPSCNKMEHSVRVLKYIFPRQFGLHNVFTSVVDSRETKQSLKDYTLREQEIAEPKRVASIQGRNSKPVRELPVDHIPKRLRGRIKDLVKKLQRLHSRCSYFELLKHYCSNSLVDSQDRAHRFKASTAIRSTWTAPSEQRESAGKRDLIDFATPTEYVSAFCRAVLSNMIPLEIWGVGEDGKRNQSNVMRHISRFIHLRRFENMTLHDVVQDIKIQSVHWLVPPNVKNTAKTSASDLRKRKEVFYEFLYYVFDSLLVPLIRSNFHVTESTTHRNRLFFFRHDIWRALTEPALGALKLSMFDEIPFEQAKRLLDSRTLGFSQVRLLPKGARIRPIMNLSRKVIKTHNGKSIVGMSINDVMGPVLAMLNYEKANQPARLGSALFSVSDLHPRLKTFQNRIKQIGTAPHFYFAKVDVQSCFDTIPQNRVLQLIDQLASENEYRFVGHTELNSSESTDHQSPFSCQQKPARKFKFVSRARASDDSTSFEEALNKSLAIKKKGTIFVDSVSRAVRDTTNLIDLLREHVERNVVKIGKKFFRQKRGIPQGSVVSSILCNFFYADFERECLHFLDEDSILLRLIDDFLLITTNKQHAKMFMQTMHDGNDSYGIQVNADKSMTNFGLVVNDAKVPCLKGSMVFPYCGGAINVKTLEMTRDRSRRQDAALADSLTVEPSRIPGQTFYSKALKTFKIQSHAMYLDTTHNSMFTVLCTLYENFVESAMKVYRYATLMGKRGHPHTTLLIKTISSLLSLASALTSTSTSTSNKPAIRKPHLQWLALTAFHTTLHRKQSRYAPVLTWLERQREECVLGDEKTRRWLGRIVKRGEGRMRRLRY